MDIERIITSHRLNPANNAEEIFNACLEGEELSSEASVFWKF